MSQFQGLRRSSSLVKSAAKRPFSHEPHSVSIPNSVSISSGKGLPFLNSSIIFSSLPSPVLNGAERVKWKSKQTALANGSCRRCSVRDRRSGVEPSKTGYFTSLSQELQSQSQRVRQLIGSAHWGHDGRHKELLLMELIRRHCPASVLVSTGFVISPNNLETRSAEQDVIIVDTSKEAPLFNQGGLAIAFAHTLLAAVSVKTTMEPGSLKQTVDGLQTVREVVRDAGLKAEQVWCGGFFFEIGTSWSKNPALIYNNVKHHILENPARPPVVDDGQPNIVGPNCIADSGEVALIFDYERFDDKNTAKARGYSCSGVATAIFMSSLLQHIAFSFGATHLPFADLVDSLGVAKLTPSKCDIVA